MTGLDLLQEAGIFLEKIIKQEYPDDDAIYVIVIKDTLKKIKLSINELLNFNKFRERFVKATNKDVNFLIKGKDWKICTDYILNKLLIVEMTDEETDISIVKGIIEREILSDNYIDNLEYIDNRIICIGETIYLRISTISLMSKFDVKISRKTIGNILRSNLGFETTIVKNGKKSLRCWSISKENFLTLL